MEPDVNRLLELLPRLIRNNDTVKGAIISALSGVVTTRDDIQDAIKEMDRRFEAVDKRFEAMDKRFEAVDKRFDVVETKLNDVGQALKSIQASLGKPFEQFARNVVCRILEGEGLTKVVLKPITIKDPEGTVFPETREIEVDGMSNDPPVIVEITSILRGTNKVEKYLKKKAFVEEQQGKTFRGFFVAGGTELDHEETARVMLLLKQHGAELVNL